MCYAFGFNVTFKHNCISIFNKTFLQYFFYWNKRKKGDKKASPSDEKVENETDTDSKSTSEVKADAEKAEKSKESDEDSESESSSDDDDDKSDAQV